MNQRFISKAWSIGSRLVLHLSDDLLSRGFTSRRSHPVAGHCYVVSEALWHALYRPLALRPHVARLCKGGTHWWLAGSGIIVDLTALQFHKDELPDIYALGRCCGFLTLQPSKRARQLLRRAANHA